MPKIPKEMKEKYLIRLDFKDLESLENRIETLKYLERLETVDRTTCGLGPNMTLVLFNHKMFSIDGEYSSIKSKLRRRFETHYMSN